MADRVIIYLKSGTSYAVDVNGTSAPSLLSAFRNAADQPDALIVWQGIGPRRTINLRAADVAMMVHEDN